MKKADPQFFDKDKSALWNKGQEMRIRLTGPVNVAHNRSSVYTDRHMAKFEDICLEWLFAEHWNRPGLDLKAKTMAVMVAGASMGEPDALSQHVRFCRIHGWSEDEIVDTILHIQPYIGVPKARKALIVARQVFREMDERGELKDG